MAPGFSFNWDQKHLHSNIIIPTLGDECIFAMNCTKTMYWNTLCLVNGTCKSLKGLIEYQFENVLFKSLVKPAICSLYVFYNFCCCSLHSQACVLTRREENESERQPVSLACRLLRRVSSSAIGTKRPNSCPLPVIG